MDNLGLYNYKLLLKTGGKAYKVDNPLTFIQFLVLSNYVCYSSLCKKELITEMELHVMQKSLVVSENMQPEKAPHQRQNNQETSYPATKWVACLPISLADNLTMVCLFYACKSQYHWCPSCIFHHPSASL